MSCKREIILQALFLQLAFFIFREYFPTWLCPIFFFSSCPVSFCQRCLCWFSWSFSGECLGCFWVSWYYWQCYNAHNPLTFSLNINFDCASAICIYFPCQIVNNSDKEKLPWATFLHHSPLHFSLLSMVTTVIRVVYDPYSFISMHLYTYICMCFCYGSFKKHERYHTICMFLHLAFFFFKILVTSQTFFYIST